MDIGDAISTLGFLFSQGQAPACMDAADANDDGAVDIGDAIYVLGFLFSNGPPPPFPFPAPGLDPTPADPFHCGEPCAPEEICNGLDDDCDGTIDEEPIDGVPWWPDGDGDGFGASAATPVVACAAPAGHVGNDDDCDDGDPSVLPGAPELCDGQDDDCDGAVDEDAIDATVWWSDDDGDGYGDPSEPAVLACAAPPGRVADATDCDDTDPSIHPGAIDPCGGADQDCDGSVDPPLLDDILEPARPPVAMPIRMPLPAEQDGWSGSASARSIITSRAEVVRDEVDLHLPGVGIDLIFQRRYRSRHIGASGAMGNQWEHSYEIRAHLQPDGLHLRCGDNREDVLLLQPDGVHYAKVGLPVLAHSSGVDIFVEFGNGGNWRLEPAAGGGGGGGVGGWRIAQSADAHGNTLHFAYDAADRLATITDTVGRIVTLSYDSAGRLVTLADGTGRVWSYAYYLPGETGGSAGDLKSVTSPPIIGTPTGNDFPLGRTTRYTYTSGHADERLNHDLLTITDPRGAVRVEYVYDLDPTSPLADALLHVDVGGHRWANSPYCEDATAANGGAVRRVIENDDRGAVTERFYDAHHRLVMCREFTGFAPDPLAPTSPSTNRPGPPLRPTDPPYFETRYEWNSDHRLTRVIHPAGNESLFVHEADLDPSVPFLARTNLRQAIRTPGTHVPPGPFPALVESFVVAPGFGGFAGDRFRVQITDARGSITVVARDTFGNPTQIQHALPGVVEDFEYDIRGRLTAHVHAAHSPPGLPPVRRRDEFTYHSSGPGSGLLAARVVDAPGSALTTSHEYDGRGNIVRVVHPSGNDDIMTRNALGEVVAHLSRTFGTVPGTRYETRCWYDANGNRVRIDLQNRDANGALVLTNPSLTRIREFDPFDRLTRTLDEKGSVAVLSTQLDGTGLPAGEFVVRELVHDAAGRLLLVRSGAATSGAHPDATIAFEYDERDLLHREIRAPGTPDASTMQWSYAANGQPNALERSGFATGPRQSTSIHDGYDRLVSTTDPMGNVRTQEYDENGNRTRLLLHGELADLPGGAANVRLREYEWDWDLLDRCVAELEHRFDPASQLALSDGRNENWNFAASGHLLSHFDDSGDTTTYEYDSAGRLLRTTDALGNHLELAYDAQSNIVSVLRSDLSGVTPGLVVERLRTYAYDGLDRRISATGPLGETRQWAHAWYGVGRTIDERGNVRRHLADSLGRVTSVEWDLTASGTGGSPVIGTAVQQFGFDDNDNLVLRIDPNGNPTSYEYDALDRRVRTVRADATEESATWSPFGECLTEVDANGTLRTYTYDALARRIASSILAAPGIDPSATFESFVLDAEGRIRSAANDDVIVARSYDSLGHPVAETVDGLTMSVATDDEGNPTLLGYPSGREVSYLTDPLGRVALVTEAGALHSQRQYLGPDLLERRTTGDGVTTDYTYDASGRLVLESALHAGLVVRQHAYGWDAARNLVSRVDQTPGSTQITKLHGYDSLGRLVSTQATSPALPPALRTYQLDPAGNRVSIGGTPPTGVYAMSPVLPEPADAQMNQYTLTPTDARQYSARGELASVTALLPGQPEVLYAYDGLGQLRQANGTDVSIEVGYDALGRLAWVEQSGIRERYTRAWSKSPASIHDIGGAETESSIFDQGWGHGWGRAVSLRRSGSPGTTGDFTLHRDGAGSVVLLTGALGAVVERYEYEDYGKRTVRDLAGNVVIDSAVGNAQGFHGHRHASSGGPIIVGGGRFLDEATGRMLSPPSDKDARHPDFLRWGAVDVPPGDYCGSNPTSATSVEREWIGRPLPSGQRIIAGKGNGDGDLVSPLSWIGHETHNHWHFDEFSDLDSDTGAIDFVRWGAIDDPSAVFEHGDIRHPYVLGSLWVQDDTPDGESVYGSISIPMHKIPVDHGTALSMGWWGHCNGWAGALSTIPASIPDPNVYVRVDTPIGEPGFVASLGPAGGKNEDTAWETCTGGVRMIEMVETTIGGDRRVVIGHHQNTWFDAAARCRAVIPQKLPLGGSVSGNKGRSTLPLRTFVPAMGTLDPGGSATLGIEYHGLRSNLYPFTKN